MPDREVIQSSASPVVDGVTDVSENVHWAQPTPVVSTRRMVMVG